VIYSYDRNQQDALFLKIKLRNSASYWLLSYELITALPQSSLFNSEDGGGYQNNGSNLYE